MPFPRPTIAALRSSASQAIAAGLPGVDTLVRYSNLGILGDVQSGLADGCYGYLDWIAQQSVPFTATDEFLAAWAALRRVYIKDAAAASGTASFPWTAGTIGLGTQITRGDGAAFVTTGAATVAGGTITVPVSAVTPGAAGNTPVGTMMFLSTGITGITPQGVVAAAIAGGADIETQDDFRSRMLQAYQAQLQGGAAADYIQWALSVPGVTRAWCIPRGYGPGTVQVYFMMDVVEAAYGGFPQGSNGLAAGDTRDVAATGDQLVVANYLATVQPVCPRVYALAPTANTIAMTISGLAGAGATVQANVAAAFAAALQVNASPGGTPNGGVTDISAIESAISAVAGTSGFVITNITASAGSVSPGSAGNITSNKGALAVPGAITYT
ncbi:baseplate J/gp47 family protein [Novosphingobium sp. FSW06-99]|uniref:baseplate J/gp47 family protein n=1 Tax=Novosphingobium sp. FSW06-99 TaxID=1739113 RepID=UPI00076C4BF8|nr:baseplate J/gp47 family protein [Novosphingobium sp. FSW06-99]KUR80751.1 phage baseplate protein [Novosphingobium sp. FSW06-99]